jgi:hypothetical protein
MIYVRKFTVLHLNSHNSVNGVYRCFVRPHRLLVLSLSDANDALHLRSQGRADIIVTGNARDYCELLCQLRNRHQFVTVMTHVSSLAPVA